MTDTSYLYQYFLQRSPDEKKTEKQDIPAALKQITKNPINKEVKKHE